MDICLSFPQRESPSRTHISLLRELGAYGLRAFIAAALCSSSLVHGQQQVSQSISPISPEEALRIAIEFIAVHGNTLDAQDNDLATQVLEQETPAGVSERPREEADFAQERVMPTEPVTPAPVAEKTEQVVSSLPPENQPSGSPSFEKEIVLDIEPTRKGDLSIRLEGFSPSIAPPKSLLDIPSSEAPKASQNAALPTPSPIISIEAEGIKLRASPSTTSFGLKANETVLEAQVGAGYQSTSDKSTTASFSIGTLLNEDVAVGGTITSGKYRSDVTANLIKQLSSQEHLSLSLGYMRGSETYQFFTGEARIGLSQSSIGLEYRNKFKTGRLGFKSFGLSIWGTQAKQIDRLDAVTKTVETETSVDTYLDTRQLSVGTLFGASLTGSFRPTRQLQIEPSLGYERLIFPFSDGSRELHRSQIASLDLAYSFNKSQSLTWSTRWGLSETRSSLGLKWGDWSLNVYRSKGEHRLHDSKGMTLSYALLNTGNSNLTSAPPRSSISALSLYGWQLEDKALGERTLLEMASSRPVVFTRVWLAKVDPTSVKLIQTIPKVVSPPPPITTLSWTTTSLSKIYFDTGSPKRTAINFSVAAKANDGSAISYSWGDDPSNLQSVLTLNPLTGAVTGSHPAVITDKTYTFTIIASAQGVEKTSDTFSVTIKSPVRVRYTTGGAVIELGSAITTATSITFPAELASIELAVVGGGGGGGFKHGGGGGGGMVGYSRAFPVIGGETVSLSVGRGGLGAQSINERGVSGTATSFGTLSVTGGGGGGTGLAGSESGLIGGSGGGASHSLVNNGKKDSRCGSQEQNVDLLCEDGGAVDGVSWTGSGGGGADGPGGDNSGMGGEGGPGFSLPDSLGNGFIGAGGGGGGRGLAATRNFLPGSGGSGVGGDGSDSGSGSNAVADTGSGGGGGAELNITGEAGGAGSDGLILLRY